MLLFINNKTLEYPISEETVNNSDNVGDYSLVIKTIPPLPCNYAKIVERPPIFTDGQYYQSFMSVTIFKDITTEDGVVHSAADQEAAIKQRDELQRQNVIKNVIVRELQRRLDSFAKAKRYDNIAMLVLRAGYSGPFQAEGLYGAVLMDQTWKVFIDIFADVDAGKRPFPESFSEIEKELPVLEWV